MESLARIHNTTHGVGFLSDQQSQLNVSNQGDITTNGFLDVAILKQIDPDPRTSDLGIKDHGLWLYLTHPEYVGGIRLMDIPDHLVDQATAAVSSSRQRITKRARA